LVARLVLDPAFVVGAVDRRLFGSFVDHMGRCVYTGIYEPGHPTADADGFREDVLELVRELGVTAIRYPGGNFVSNYDWEYGVEPIWAVNLGTRGIKELHAEPLSRVR
jgi:alpha-N-arabinofuranosidase